MTNKAIEAITAQMQENKDNPLIQKIGESLITLCENEHTAEIISQDLSVKEMSLKHCYDKFHNYASTHKSGNCFVGGEDLTEQLIREFYGLHEETPKKANLAPARISLADLL